MVKIYNVRAVSFGFEPHVEQSMARAPTKFPNREQILRNIREYLEYEQDFDIKEGPTRCLNFNLFNFLHGTCEW